MFPTIPIRNRCDLSDEWPCLVRSSEWERKRGQRTVWPCRPTGSWTVMQPLVCQLWTNWRRSIHKRSPLSRDRRAFACVRATTLYGNDVYYFPRPVDCVFAVVPRLTSGVRSAFCVRLSVLWSTHHTLACCHRGVSLFYVIPNVETSRKEFRFGLIVMQWKPHIIVYADSVRF